MAHICVLLFCSNVNARLINTDYLVLISQLFNDPAWQCKVVQLGVWHLACTFGWRTFRWSLFSSTKLYVTTIQSHAKLWQPSLPRGDLASPYGLYNMVGGGWAHHSRWWDSSLQRGVRAKDDQSSANSAAAASETLRDGSRRKLAEGNSKHSAL